MLFNSFIFIGLVIATFLLYYIPRFSKFQVHLLILTSLVFYSWHNPILLLLLLGSAGINILSSYYVVYGNPDRRKTLAIAGVASNLLILSFFKYSGLLAGTFSFNEDIGEFLLTIPLPFGISFFTFQGISLVVDVFKERHHENESIVSKSLATHARKTLFFISFFPQLVAGPIVKAHDFLPQIKTKYLKDVRWDLVFKSVVLGYFLKMVVADNLKDYTFWIEYPFFLKKDTITLLTMLFGYSCQIFADFAGYSLIAIGISRMFGYNLKDNFNFPYIASSFREFWKRWHISLSSFLQEYLYIPLGGNRKGKYRTYINLMITMVLGGLWHGAAWSYAVWGAFHGIALAVERFLTDRITIKAGRFIIVIKRLMVFVFITFAWLLFKLPEFTHVIEYFKALYTNASLHFDITICTRILVYSSPIFIYHALYLLKKKKYEKVINKYSYAFYGVMLFLIVTNSGIPGSFIYFQF